MADPVLHVRAETRTVYRSARGVKLTRHAAYIAAAKKLIADRCAAWDEARMKAWEASLPDFDDIFEPSEDFSLSLPPAPPVCMKDGPYQCRFHTWPVHERGAGGRRARRAGTLRPPRRPGARLLTPPNLDHF